MKWLRSWFNERSIITKSVIMGYAVGTLIFAFLYMIALIIGYIF